ncbi:MAG: F0F1 ATP synthase subunit A [Candidatus Paceibacterota bacterium]|jgi:F-type H+-transporting ATPase subunit a|nr:F0F1 ATP synthase subunit A [Candidatus Paceibacterota bacterium]MDD4830618.1 F0F1 ATP synthase subunit A [Candidatus Paceibacterota bacterium]MDD4875192.1 F0F1 ATP synthase subunit A [Candidatus Paceibacterota bacterium]
MEEISIEAAKFFQIGDFPVTNTFLLIVLIGGFLSLLFFWAFKKNSISPGKIQNFLEWILESYLNFIDSVTHNRAKSEKVFPIAVTLFLMILLSNLTELLPGLGLFHFLRSPSSDINFTLALAILSVFFINFSAVKELGFFSYLKRFLDFRSPVAFFVGILEGLGEFTRIISLSMRLFGNLFAGETLLIVVATGIHWSLAYLIPLPFLALEILVGFIQAFIFSSLVVVFYTTATVLHEE